MIESLYTDLDLEFLPKVKGRKTDDGNVVFDVRTLSGVSSIIRSLKNIVLTIPGENRFNFNYGTEIFKSLFELMPLGIEEAWLSRKIKEQLNLHEPRVLINEIKIIENYHEQSLIVTIDFTVKTTHERYQLPITLDRVR